MLSKLPADVLSEITSRLDLDDFTILWLCGDAVLNWILSVNGGARNLEFKIHPRRSFRFPSFVTSAWRFDRLCLASEFEALRADLVGLDVASLPRSVTDLTLKCCNAQVLVFGALNDKPDLLQQLRRLTLKVSCVSATEQRPLRYLINAWFPCLELLNLSFERGEVPRTTTFHLSDLPASLTSLSVVFSLLKLELDETVMGLDDWITGDYDEDEVEEIRKERRVLLGDISAASTSATTSPRWPPFLTSLRLSSLSPKFAARFHAALPSTLTLLDYHIHTPSSQTSSGSLSLNFYLPPSLLGLTIRSFSSEAAATTLIQNKLPSLTKLVIRNLVPIMDSTINLAFLRALPPSLTYLKAPIQVNSAELASALPRNLRKMDSPARISYNVLQHAPNCLETLSIERTLPMVSAMQFPRAYKHLKMPLTITIAETGLQLPEGLESLSFHPFSDAIHVPCFWSLLPAGLHALTGTSISDFMGKAFVELPRGLKHLELDRITFPSSPNSTIPPLLDTHHLPRSLTHLHLGGLGSIPLADDCFAGLPPGLRHCHLSTPPNFHPKTPIPCLELRTLYLQLIPDSHAPLEDILPLLPSKLTRLSFTYPGYAKKPEAPLTLTPYHLATLPRGVTLLNLPSEIKWEPIQRPPGIPINLETIRLGWWVFNFVAPPKPMSSYQERSKRIFNTVAAVAKRPRGPRR